MDDARFETYFDRPITERTFFKGFFSALRTSGIEYIPVINDVHHTKFKSTVALLDNLRDTNPVAGRMPYFYPGPVTGSYEIFDGELLSLQAHGITRVIGRPAVAVELITSEPLAAHIFSKFHPQEQDLFQTISHPFTQR